MKVSPAKTRIYEFGDFRVDGENRLLWQGAQEIPLTPKAFDILLVFVENSGALLEKDELMQRVWADSFVEEGNLTRNISTLRKALGEDPKAPKYIVTVSGHGYRFTAEVHEAHENHQLLIAEQTTIHATFEEEQTETDEAIDHAQHFNQESLPIARSVRTTNYRKGFLILALTGLFIIGLSLTWRFIAAKWSDTSSSTLRFRNLDEVANWKVRLSEGMTYGSFSPDGKLLAFTNASDGKNGLRVKQLVGEAYKITSDEEECITPVWSADSQYLAFIAKEGNQAKIWSLPYLGGIAQRKLLATFADEGQHLVKWATDGKTIYYELKRNLYALDLESGESSALTNFDPKASRAYQFALSFDEEQIAYTDYSESDKRFHIFAIQKRGGIAAQITKGDYDADAPSWFPDGRHIAYISNRSGDYHVWISAVNNSETVMIPTIEGNFSRPVVSPDGSRMYLFALKDNANIFSCKVDTAQETQHTSSFAIKAWAECAPDNSAITYQAMKVFDELYESRIWINPINSDATPYRIAPQGFYPTWSPDGKEIAFLRRAGKNRDIWTINPKTGEEKRLAEGGLRLGYFTEWSYKRANTAEYSWSPDSSRIAWFSMKSGQSNLWIVARDGTNEIMASNNEDPDLQLFAPLWSPDGERIACGSRGKTTERICIIKQGKLETLYEADAASSLRVLGWSVSGSEIFFASASKSDSSFYFSKQAKIFSLSVADDKIKELAPLTNVCFHTIKLSPDRKSIAFIARQGGTNVLADGKDNLWVMPANGNTPRRLTDNQDSTTYLSEPSWSPDSNTLYYGKQNAWSVVSIVELSK